MFPTDGTKALSVLAGAVYGIFHPTLEIGRIPVSSVDATLSAKSVTRLVTCDCAIVIPV
jgi:hypothetical protein